MSSVCRICLSVNMRLCSLKNDLLIYVYEKLSSTKFNSEDARPRAVCCYCYQKLQRCHTFSQMVHRSEQIFSRFSHQGFEAVQKGISEANLEMKQHLSVATMQFIALDGYTTNAGSQVIIKDEPKPGVKIKDEPIMKEEVSTEEENLVEVDWVTASITEDGQSTFEKDNSDKEDSDQGGRNDVEELPSYSYAEQNKRDDSRIPFCCNNCKKIFFFKKELISHLRKSHSPQKRKQYTKKCTKSSRIVKVKVMPNQKRQFACCDVCNKKFPNKSYLVIHMRIHTGNKPYSCTVCDNNFSQKSSLGRHMRSHTGEKTFACNKCNNRFLQNQDLTRHMRTHTGERPFVCKVCDKRFNRKAHLVGHMRIHTGETPFACNVCDKKFSRKDFINRHMSCHSGEKTFTCN